MSENQEKNAVKVLPPERRRRAFFIFVGWTLFGLFFACQAYLSNVYLGRHVSFGRILVPWLSLAYIWALLTPLVVKLARRFPLEKGKLLRGVTFHLIIGTLFSVFQVAVYVVAYVFSHEWAMGNSPPASVLLRSYQRLLVAEFHFSLFVYGLLIGLYYAYNYYRSFREHERRAAQLQVQAAQLETQLAQAQLDALKMQLHPHFFFNTLNALSALIYRSPKEADRMITQLGDLFRIALRKDKAQEVSLAEELDFLKAFLQIHQTLMGNRLQVDWKIEPETLSALVPNLILQPLVENSIRHGLAPLEQGGRIEIRAKRQNGRLVMQVGDSGVGLASQEGRNNGGVGVANTKARLKNLYGSQHRFEIGGVPGEGTVVSIEIPFQEEMTWR